MSRCPFVATLLWAIPFWTQCQDGLPMADGFHEIWDVRAREKALTSSVDDKEHEFPGLICLPRPIASSYLTFAVISAVQKSGNTPNSLFVSDQIASNCHFEVNILFLSLQTQTSLQINSRAWRNPQSALCCDLF